MTLPGVLFPELLSVCEHCGRTICHPVSLATGHGRRCRSRVLGLNRAGRPLQEKRVGDRGAVQGGALAGVAEVRQE
jgi:hypothetical protein